MVAVTGTSGPLKKVSDVVKYGKENYLNSGNFLAFAKNKDHAITWK